MEATTRATMQSFLSCSALERDGQAERAGKTKVTRGTTAAGHPVAERVGASTGPMRTIEYGGPADIMSQFGGPSWVMMRAHLMRIRCGQIIFALGDGRTWFDGMARIHPQCLGDLMGLR